MKKMSEMIEDGYDEEKASKSLKKRKSKRFGSKKNDSIQDSSDDDFSRQDNGSVEGTSPNRNKQKNPKKILK
jgi:hypothetical protein